MKKIVYKILSSFLTIHEQQYIIVCNKVNLTNLWFWSITDGQISFIEKKKKKSQSSLWFGLVAIKCYIEDMKKKRKYKFYFIRHYVR